MEKKYHYVYEITYADNKKYIGVRSCNCEINEDPYMGSGFHIPAEIKVTGNKTILSTHETRELAMLEEIRLHKELDVKNNPNYYNQCNSTSTKFQASKEAHLRSAETRRGRTKETHAYINKQIEARKKYKGDNRTEAQKAQFSPDKMPDRIRKYNETLANSMKDPEKAKHIKEARVRGGQWNKGRKNPKKGKLGITHIRVEPWWFIAPNRSKIEVYDSIRNYYTNNPNVFPFSAASIMRYLRDNKIPEYLKKQGWDFGKITGEK